VTATDEFAKEIAKQLPVKVAYQDAIQPAAKQTGEFGEDLLKALRLALFPIQLAAGLQDRFRHFVRASVARDSPRTTSVARSTNCRTCT
jgi:hypothetical protein